MKPHINQFACIALLPLLLSACGNVPQTFLNSLTINTSTQNNDTYVNLSATVSLGSTTLASLSIPIQDPKSGVVLGQVSLSTNASQQEQITLSVNETALVHGDSSLGSTMPNGQPLPLALGAATGSVLGIPILQKSRIYIGGDLKSKIIVGVAFAIQALDGVTSGMGIPANVFFSNQFGTQVFGLAGLFTSPNVGENGIAVFGTYTVPANVPSPLVMAANQTQARVVTKNRTTPTSTRAPLVSDAPTAAEVKTTELTSKQENRIGSYFMKKRVLRVQ